MDPKTAIINLQLTFEQVAIIAGHLAKAPWGEVAPIMASLQAQVAAQMPQPNEAPAAGPTVQ